MKVKLLDSWMGHPKGSVLDLLPVVAMKIVERGQAEGIEEAIEDEEKQIDQPDMEDKEFRSGKNKILKRRR